MAHFGRALAHGLTSAATSPILRRMEHRHAIDCPGGPICICGVAPHVQSRTALPRPVRVDVLAIKQQARPDDAKMAQLKAALVDHRRHPPLVLKATR